MDAKLWERNGQKRELASVDTRPDHAPHSSKIARRPELQRLPKAALLKKRVFAVKTSWLKGMMQACKTPQPADSSVRVSRLIAAAVAPALKD